MPSEHELARLRWQCRRGLLELDLLLAHYLEHHYADADVAERGLFRRLLEEEDPRLQRWLLFEERPADEALAALVERLRALTLP